MRIAIGCDHAGFELKEFIREALAADTNLEVSDFGTYNPDSVDYADFGHLVAQAIESGRDDFGILICGSGIGVSITANRHRGVRAALCWLVEIAQLARKHNDANIICIPARFVNTKLALDMVKAFLLTSFEGGRHQRRVEKIEGEGSSPI
jgi:ribose 5-phosphate isomerase B